MRSRLLHHCVVRTILARDIGSDDIRRLRWPAGQVGD
jgi:hypothetical protein